MKQDRYLLFKNFAEANREVGTLCYIDPNMILEMLEEIKVEDENT